MYWLFEWNQTYEWQVIMCFTGVCVSGCMVMSVSHARWYSVVVACVFG